MRFGASIGRCGAVRGGCEGEVRVKGFELGGSGGRLSLEKERVALNH